MRVADNLGRIPALFLHFVYDLAHLQDHLVVNDGVGMVEEDKIDSGHGNHLHLLAKHPFVVGVVVAPQRLAPPVRLAVGAYHVVILME